MLKFLFERVLSGFAVLFVVFTLSFFIMRLAPGSPLSDEKAVDEATQQNLERRYNLDKPLLQQYWLQLGSVVWDWDLGYSFKQRDRKVNDIIAESAPYSFVLGAQALCLALLIGLPLGLLAGLKPGTWLDHGLMTVALLGVSVPNFVLGPLLVLVFALGLGWFHPTGWESWRDTLLPSLTLAMYYAAYIARLTRSGMLEVVRADYIRTARAKGLSEGLIVTRHALKGALLPVVSYLGPAAAGVLTGSVVVERIFSLPGLGHHFVTAALNRDYALVLGTVMVFSVLLVVLNIVVDVAYAWLDPRVQPWSA